MKIKIKMPCTKAAFLDKVNLITTAIVIAIIFPIILVFLYEIAKQDLTSFKGIKPIIAEIWCGDKECLKDD